MSLKQLIKRQQILKNAATCELELPGEPLIYSIKYSVGHRRRGVQFFRNEKWKSLLRCYFRSYYKTKTPVVVIVRFYVTPPDSVSISAQRLKSESVPAVFSYELCDYLLSFIEMLHHVLINSYKQIVKVEMDKFYSKNPRTVFQFMSWEDYVRFQDHDSVYSEGESISPSKQVRRPLQSECEGHEPGEGACDQASRSESNAKADGTSASDMPLSDPGTPGQTASKAKAAAPEAAHNKARRRQPRKVPE